MSDDTDSCLVTHLSAYISLTDDERERIAEIEDHEERRYRTGQRVLRREEPMEDLHLVKSGWLHACTDASDGRRHIVRTHHAGDIVGLGNLDVSRAATDIVASTDSVLCAFPRRAMGEIVTSLPRLAALLIALGARDQVVLIDLLRATTRLSAQERVLHLLLSLLHRLRVTNRHVTDTFELKLNQSEMGDTLGLTNVSVSKAMKELEQQGALARQRQTVTLKDVPALAARIEFVDRFTKIDTSWFPEAS